MDEPKEQALSYEDFKEQVIADPTFAGKLAMLEGPLEPKNLKDRSALIASYVQDTADQFRADTETFNKMLAEFELKWNGKQGQDGRRTGGLTDTTQKTFSWMKEAFDSLAEHRRRELARAIQTMALQEAEANASYDELARVYGDPKAAITSILKLVNEQHALIVKLSAKDNEIQGNIKLGDEQK